MLPSMTIPLGGPRNPKAAGGADVSTLTLFVVSWLAKNFPAVDVGFRQSDEPRQR